MGRRFFAVRWFLVWITLVATVVVVNPTFWWLVAAELGAAPVTELGAGGTARQALLGPKAPWPAWALRPEGGRFAVKAWFGPSATESATGFGELTLAGDVGAATNDYVARLQSAGFAVTATLWTSVLPTLPPTEFVTCHIVAQAKEDPARTMTATIDRAPVAGRGRVHWLEGPPPAARPKIDGPPC